MTPAWTILALSGELGFTWGLHACVLAALVALSGIFSGSEAVLFSLSARQLEQAQASASALRRAAAALRERPRQTLSTILMANTAVNVLIFTASYMFSGSWWIGMASVVLVLVGGEVVPKVLGVALADRLAPYSAAVVAGSGYVIGPIERVMDYIVVEPLSRLIHGRSDREASAEFDLSTRELKALLDLSRRKGVLDHIEDSYLQRLIELSYVRVRDIMVPRVEVETFDVGESADALREHMRRTRRTKIPVYDGSIDNIVGLVYAKVLFFERKKTLRELVMPVTFVPELISGEQLLEHFRATRSQIAIAVDEHGGMAGLVTLEDLAEEIVGEIYDAEDQRRTPDVVQRSETEFDISGTLSLQHWENAFGGQRLNSRVATVGGLVTARLGRPAHEDDVVRIGNVELRVIETRGRRIERLRLRHVAPASSSGANL